MVKRTLTLKELIELSEARKEGRKIAERISSKFRRQLAKDKKNELTE